MKVVTIVAGSAAEALAEVHRQLGPNAVVVNVRKTSGPGLSRIWKKPQIEVQAALPTAPAPVRAPMPPGTAQNIANAKKEAASHTSKRRDEWRRQVDEPDPEPAAPRRSRSPLDASLDPRLRQLSQESVQSNGNRSEAPLDLAGMLENLGILPLHAHWLVDQVRAKQARRPSMDLREEFGLVQDFLVQFWNRLAVRTRTGTHHTRIFVGAPGVGKTTCLCKWLTQEVLLQNRQAKVWRLDAHTANTAEFLSIHGEILGVPVERIWTDQTANEGVPLQFVDVPGVPTNNQEAIAALAEQLSVFKRAEILLVLNAAYDLNHLLAHVRAFATLPLAGVVLTHLDEDNRWSKFWNLLLGSKLPILYLSGGQNIPGQFGPASPQSLFEVVMEG